MSPRPFTSSADFETQGPETWELIGKLAKVIGVRRIARAVGRTERAVYYWTHDPLTAEGSDGHTNLLDWCEALVEAVASMPRARGELLELENWFRRLFNRVLRNEDPEPITDTELLQRCALAAKEHGEAMSELLNLEGDEADALHEALEARDALDRIILGLESRDAIPPIRRTA